MHGQVDCGCSTLQKNQEFTTRLLLLRCIVGEIELELLVGSAVPPCYLFDTGSALDPLYTRERAEVDNNAQYTRALAMNR